MTYTKYIALGDSVTIDLYPALDAGAIDVAVALERETSAGKIAPLGAASLLFAALEQLHPGIELQNVAMDGGTIGDVFGEQIPQTEETDEPVLVTLTIGGNDLLSAYGNKPKHSLLQKIESDIAEAYDFLVDMIRGRFPNGTLIVNTVYDPSDRTGRIPGVYDALPPMPLDILDRFNDHIRALVIGTPGVLLGDIYAHFLGHGVSVPEKERWYWKRSLIEPNARGAEEVRNVWLDVLSSRA